VSSVGVANSQSSRTDKKIMEWRAIRVNSLVDNHAFKCIMNDAYYVRLLDDHLISYAREQFTRC
jgi:hypothetical protein